MIAEINQCTPKKSNSKGEKRGQFTGLQPSHVEIPFKFENTGYKEHFQIQFQEPSELKLVSSIFRIINSILETGSTI